MPDDAAPQEEDHLEGDEERLFLTPRQWFAQLEARRARALLAAGDTEGLVAFMQEGAEDEADAMMRAAGLEGQAEA